jgi:hypothetical protein
MFDLHDRNLFQLEMFVIAAFKVMGVRITKHKLIFHHHWCVPDNDASLNPWECWTIWHITGTRPHYYMNITWTAVKVLLVFIVEHTIWWRQRDGVVWDYCSWTSEHLWLPSMESRWTTYYIVIKLNNVWFTWSQSLSTGDVRDSSIQSHGCQNCKTQNNISPPLMRAW